jgi:peptide chain release factor
MSVWLQISSGEGPAECCWVVARLREVLSAEAAAAGLEAHVLEAVAGDQPGTCRAVLLALSGPGEEAFAEPWLGTIQWVGRSPYRPNHRRKNWFVGVERFAPPEAPAWSPDELRVEVMRSPGPGGQHVNKTESAVRVTHLPTGLSAIAREERSQHKNRNLALARLARLFEERRAEAEGDVRRRRRQQHHALERGNAVRVYEGPDFRLRRG